MIFLTISILLSSCSKQIASTKSTPISLTSLSVSIFLVNSESAVKPFAFYAELRQENQNRIIGKADFDNYPEIKFENIAPGTYEFWTLIHSYSLSISNCYDIGLPDKTWKLGKILDDAQAVFIEDIGYREALFQSLDEQPADSNAHDFYAVLEGLEIQPGTENKIEVDLVCMSK